MRKAAIVGKNKPNVQALRRHLLLHNFIYDQKRPDFVISLGGDGTYLYAERLYPGVPKLLVRDSTICDKGGEDVLDAVIDRLKRGKYAIKECIKLDAYVNGKCCFTCANDLVLRNRRLTQAIRFSLDIDGKQVDGELIGDGLVIATPYGSTAYFSSITRRHFAKGIGIAFNNLTRAMRPKTLPERSRIRITMVRETAELAADNDPRTVIVKEGDAIDIRVSTGMARIITIDSGLRRLLPRELLGRRRSM